MEAITVQILGREYKLRCRPEEQSRLVAAAHRLDAEMRAVRAAGMTSSSDRIAIVAALNLVYELMQLQAQHLELQSRISQRIAKLNALVDEALTQRSSS
ncbi:cell division protein ZapA [Methylothermus subterraneus]